jgi:NADH-quinone oxidoreductase subunit I
VSSYFLSAARALATSLGNLFRRPVTVEFPKVIRPRAERYRSSFALLHEEDGDEACIGCLQCERICPSQVIAIKAGGKRESPISGKKRGYADDFVLDLNACIYCELCVQVCPTDAIVMTREPELPAYGREDLVLTMAKLYANEKSKHRAWGDATRLNGMQVPPKPPAAAKPAAAPAPAAAPSTAGIGAAATGTSGSPQAGGAASAAGSSAAPQASGPAGSTAASAATGSSAAPQASGPAGSTAASAATGSSAAPQAGGPASSGASSAASGEQARSGNGTTTSTAAPASQTTEVAANKPSEDPS